MSGIDRKYPFAGRRAALATMHGKQAVIAPPLLARLGLEVIVPEGIDTDALGAFTGEIPRPGSMKDAALAKAKLGIAATGLPIGLASEGAYGPHPAVPFRAAGAEMIVLVDDEQGLVVTEQILDEAPRFAHITTAGGDPLDRFLEKAGFPGHALAVVPHKPRPGVPQPVRKGTHDRGELARAITDLAAESIDGLALVQNDMRAHKNPTRMKAIARAIDKLIDRLGASCDACGKPGFGLADVERGLPCADCGEPTELVLWEIFACVACPHRERRHRADKLEASDPRWCQRCNP